MEELHLWASELLALHGADCFTASRAAKGRLASPAVMGSSVPLLTLHPVTTQVIVCHCVQGMCCIHTHHVDSSFHAQQRVRRGLT